MKLGKKKKTVKFRIQEFYDGGVIRFDMNVPVPSKRIGFKKENGLLIAKISSGVCEFEAEVKRLYASEHRQGGP